MIEITHFTASWLFPLLTYAAIAVPCLLVIIFKGKYLEIGVLPWFGVLLLASLCYGFYMLCWFIRHWDEIHIIPHIFKVVN